MKPVTPTNIINFKNLPDIAVDQELNTAIILKYIEDFNNLNSKYIARVDGDISMEQIKEIFEKEVINNTPNKYYYFPDNVFGFSECMVAYYEKNYYNSIESSVTLLKYVLFVEREYRSKYKKIYVFSSSSIDLSLFREKMFNFSLEPHEEIDWCYPAGNGYQTVKFPIKKPKAFFPESYPFIKDLEGWIGGYLNSSSSVLVLNGPVGTGKSTLITHMISSAKMKVMTAFDEKVMKSDSLYVNFIADEYDLLILEDADLMLMDRIGKDNDTMSKLLNVSEGIIDVGKKKIIFTANLNNLEVLDKAIRRPGRCYDIVQFRELTRDEANVIRDKIGKVPFQKEREYSLAEVYNK